MARTKAEPVEGTKSLDRALAVLLEISQRGARGMTLSECAAVLGYSKPTTHRILQTLTRREFLRLDEERGTFTLGVTNLRLGIEFLESIDLRREALPMLRALADSSGETVHLGRLSGTDVVYIEKVESSHAVRMYSRVGDTMPAYSTGIGKAVLAFLDEAELDRQLGESRALLETRLDSCETLSHPYGRADERTAAAAARAGYLGAFTLGRAHRPDEPFRRPRLGLRSADRGLRLRVQLSSGAALVRRSRAAAAASGLRRAVLPRPGWLPPRPQASSTSSRSRRAR
jgi:DNA-binding IclR family transcriptional regulator